MNPCNILLSYIKVLFLVLSLQFLPVQAFAQSILYVAGGDSLLKVFSGNNTAVNSNVVFPSNDDEIEALATNANGDLSLPPISAMA